MSTWFNVSVALMVFMGLASGGMFTLVLMSNRRQQVPFSIILSLLGVLAAIGLVASATLLHDIVVGLANSVVLIVLAFTLGYALTTFSVLAVGRRDWLPTISKTGSDQTTVICLAPGEPPDYETRAAARRLEMADDPHDVPPLLLRPFYMRDIKTKYSVIGRSPYKDYNTELASKVQARLGPSHKVVSAFYSDQPSLAQTLSTAIEDGARNVVIAHVRVTDPPDSVAAGELLEGLSPDRYKLRLVETRPLFDSQLVPQLYVRRAIEALPQAGSELADAGILLVGRGHVQAGASSVTRYIQENNFLRRVRDALVRAGFDESRVETGWLRHSPTTGEALGALVAAGAKTVYCLPASFVAEGINTLYDIPAQTRSVIEAGGIRFVSLGAWNADDLAAEEIAEQVRAVTPAQVARAR